MTEFLEKQVGRFVILKLRHRKLGLAIIAAIMTVAMTASVTTAGFPQFPLGPASNRTASGSKEQMIVGLIVKPRAHAADKITNALRAFDASDLSKKANVPLTVLRPMSG